VMEGKYGRLFTEDDLRLILRRELACGEAVIDRMIQEAERIGTKFPADEPVFVLRGRDLAARVAVEDYGATARNLGAPTAHVGDVARAAAAFRRFSIEHPDRMKVPD
jgi:hypothetical protein